VSRPVSSELNVASLPRRGAAGLIDAVVIGSPVLAVVGGATFLYIRWGERRGRDVDPMRPFRDSARWRAVVWVALEAARLPTRNWRSPGYKALGLRRVDVSTREPLSVGQVLVYDFVALASGQLRGRLMKPWLTRRKERLEALRPELKEAERAHAGDVPAQQRAMKEILDRNRVNPARSCAPVLAGAAVSRAPVLWSPLNQTVGERLAGIVVVQD
jgi:hypothetical protein